ncbi:hypothetical protein tinsulaeT_25070 [Thalassotalea insulae]|uniref:Heme exporter protein D n=1 Tax=Thalassotalea insulae TaxID=2056778 RepID=A0ABQ6GTD3_9GAMM|nr:heme exporter protein CcmD [Thalassotalea insulae]GLX79167.1 hypothetical protein tinsulaeT_25070 [Thalassotalea insulae]
MQFSSLSEFIAMDGHGFYVWLSYGVSTALLLLLVLMSLAKKKNIITQIQQRQKREQKLKQAALKQQTQARQEVNS